MQSDTRTCLHQRNTRAKYQRKVGISHVRDACEAKTPLTPLTSICQCGWGANVNGNGSNEPSCLRVHARAIASTCSSFSSICVQSPVPDKQLDTRICPGHTMTHATLPALHFIATVSQGWQWCHTTIDPHSGQWWPDFLTGTDPRSLCDAMHRTGNGL